MGRLLLVHPYELLAVILSPTEFLKRKEKKLHDNDESCRTSHKNTVLAYTVNRIYDLTSKPYIFRIYGTATVYAFLM